MTFYRELTIEKLVQEHVVATLRHTGWNKTRAAKILDVERSTLYRKLNEYGVNQPEKGEAMTSVYDEMAFIRDVHDELNRAEQSHAPLNSLHEAYAVLLEEVDELWDQVRLKRSERDDANVREELVQIAAMAWRTARNLGLEYPVEKES